MSFRAVGARMMRRILIDHARRRGGLKRGGDLQRVTLGDALLRPQDPDVDLPELLSLNDALDKLAQVDERQAHHSSTLILLAGVIKTRDSDFLFSYESNYYFHVYIIC